MRALLPFVRIWSLNSAEDGVIDTSGTIKVAWKPEPWLSWLGRRLRGGGLRGPRCYRLV